jgi:hypothetical protein
MKPPMTTPPRRRWFQFSLRTMFVVVTVLAMLIGVARVAIYFPLGIGFALGMVILGSGFWLLAVAEGKEQKAGMFWGCLLVLIGAIASLYCLSPRIE